MTFERPPLAWLLLAAGDDRHYGGNAGYDDDADAYYSWDDTVKNYRNVRVGDRVALWDKRQLLGLSVVEAIETAPDTKLVHRCPNESCGRTNISERKTMEPRFKCQRCGSEFDHPDSTPRDVIRYVSRHDAAWTSLEGLLTADQLRNLCRSPKSIHSMRELDWAAFSSALVERGAGHALARVADRSPDLSFAPSDGLAVEFPQGHTKALVRVRRGQQKFRTQLLATYGGRCAFTGKAPERVLDAGHLYSYAEIGHHHAHGGLLLRRDIHRLFDDGSLAIEPSTLRIDVGGDLGAYPQYARLHGMTPTVEIDGARVEWLHQHWSEHREDS